MEDVRLQGRYASLDQQRALVGTYPKVVQAAELAASRLCPWLWQFARPSDADTQLRMHRMLICAIEE